MKTLKVAAVIGGLYALGYGLKMRNVDLKYFKPIEFGTWWPLMSIDLLLKLDQFRHEIGRPVMISPAMGALGRVGAGTSRHNVTKWGEVQAADIMFPGATVEDLKEYFEVAKRIFGGVGVYPDWKPSAGFHVDVRPNSASWSGVMVGYNQEYFSVERAWA
ncbi:hypothetical protein [Reinekea sp.]|jgi:hypothetical protein|uniref:hypothetical protein n=1 Tax=Reinekea sp. TaxID=1970455 RepID=UPI003988B891